MVSHILKAKDIIDDYDLFLVDIWGVVLEGLEAYAGVVDTLNWIAERKPLCFVSNTPRLRPAIAQRLSSVGINIVDERIYTSGETAVKILADSKKHLGIEEPVIYHLSDPQFMDSYTEIDFNATDSIEKANVLFVTAQIDEGFDLGMYDELLDRAAQHGLVCLCVNPDTIIPVQDKLRYCPGYIVRDYKGRVVYTGKPHAEIFEAALADYPNIPRDRILMIGDTLDTDILGANNMGIKSALVDTGNSIRLFKSHGVSKGDVMTLKNFISIHPSIFLSLS